MQVDFNVSRHLTKELETDAVWDVMILHYLGLDHIGHLAGPFSPLIPNKLREMDQVIQTVFQGLLEKVYMLFDYDIFFFCFQNPIISYRMKI